MARSADRGSGLISRLLGRRVAPEVAPADRPTESTDSQADAVALISREVDAKIAEQERAAASFDSKAGVLLGLAGVIIGFTPDIGPVGLAARLSAALAAGFAIAAMLPRVSAGLNPRRLRDRYLNLDLQESRLELLDTKIWLYEQDQGRIRSKVRRLGWTVGTLAVALLLLLAGFFWIYLRGWLR